MVGDVLCIACRDKKIVKVENPQYKTSGADDEDFTLGVGLTVRSASYHCSLDFFDSPHQITSVTLWLKYHVEHIVDFIIVLQF